MQTSATTVSAATATTTTANTGSRRTGIEQGIHTGACAARTPITTSTTATTRAARAARDPSPERLTLPAWRGFAGRVQ
jgi:hypothetical protein